MLKFVCLRYFIQLDLRIFLVSLIIFIHSGNAISNEPAGECKVGKQTDCKDVASSSHNGIYSDQSNIVLKKIEQALLSYKDCTTEDGKKCSCHAEVITNDLQAFQAVGIKQDLIDSSAKYGTRYKILNHKLYREEKCMFPARCSAIEHFIGQLLPNLKNMDLVVNTRDWPQIRTGLGEKYPVFSFSKTPDYSDIMYPAWSFWAGGPAISLHPTGIGRWDLQRSILVRAAQAFPWAEKISKGFFRGSRTSDERDALVLLSRRLPELVDAQYTKNQAWKSPKDTLHAEPAKEVSFEDHCLYKYLFNFRGVAASFRLKHLFLCNSLVFHVGTEWNEFFYFAMKPWVHYVPLTSYPNEQELESMMRFFMEHDDLARQIAQRGYDFIWKHLRMEDVQCYWEKLLTDYQLLIKYEVKMEKDMKRII